MLCVHVVTGGSPINNAGTLCVGSRHDGILRRYPTGRQGNRLRRPDLRLDRMVVVLSAISLSVEFVDGKRLYILLYIINKLFFALQLVY